MRSLAAPDELLDRAWSRRPAAAATTSAAAAAAPSNAGGAAKKGGTLKVLSRPATSTASTRATGTTSPTTDGSASRPSARCTRGSRTTTTPTPDLADGAAEGLQRRQDGDDQDQGRTSSTARRSRTGPSRRPTSSTRSSAASCRRSATATRTSYYGDIEGVKAFKDGKAKEIIRHPDARRHDARVQARPSRTASLANGDALGAAVHRAGAEGVRRRSTTRASSRPTASTRCSPART